MVKKLMQQEELTILNIYAPNTGAPRYIKQVLRDLQKYLDSYKMIVGDFNVPLSTLDRSIRQKINKNTQDLNSALDHVDLTDIYRTLWPKYTEYTFFSAPHYNYSKIDHIIGSKNTPQQIQKNGSHNKHSLRPQHNQIRTQNSETNPEPHSFMETEQLALEC